MDLLNLYKTWVSLNPLLSITLNEIRKNLLLLHKFCDFARVVGVFQCSSCETGYLFNAWGQA